MCEICRREDCPDGCPSSCGTVPPYFCLICGKPLYTGDTAYDFDSRVVCEDCVLDAVFEVGA